MCIAIELQSEIVLKLFLSCSYVVANLSCVVLINSVVLTKRVCRVFDARGKLGEHALIV